jgi:hypothetical protein
VLNYFCSQMNDSIIDSESIIEKNRLKNLYSYSKQSLAPAVSTVGFFFFMEIGCTMLNRVPERKRVRRNRRKIVVMETGTKRYLSYLQLMCITDTLMNNILFLALDKTN